MASWADDRQLLDRLAKSCQCPVPAFLVHVRLPNELQLLDGYAYYSKHNKLVISLLGSWSRAVTAGSLLAAETDAYVEIALKTCLICSRQLTHCNCHPSTLLNRLKSMCLTRLSCINCLNLHIYHPDIFLHWTTRSSCQVFFSKHFWIYFSHSAGTKMWLIS